MSTNEETKRLSDTEIIANLVRCFSIYLTLRSQGNFESEEFTTICKQLQCLLMAHSGVYDTFKALFKHGPLDAGDLPSKAGKGILAEVGICIAVISKGEWSYAVDGQMDAFWKYVQRTAKLKNSGICGANPDPDGYETEVLMNLTTVHRNDGKEYIQINSREDVLYEKAAFETAMATFQKRHESGSVHGEYARYNDRVLFDDISQHPSKRITTSVADTRLLTHSLKNVRVVNDVVLASVQMIKDIKEPVFAMRALVDMERDKDVSILKNIEIITFDIVSH